MEQTTINTNLHRPSYIDIERHASSGPEISQLGNTDPTSLYLVDVRSWGLSNLKSQANLDDHAQIVLSDMSEPWEQTSGFSTNTLSNPYRRLMNTSGTAFRDHAGSMVSPFSPRVGI